MIHNKLHRYSWLILLLFALPGSADAWYKGKQYYISLGTSLAAGVQADELGNNRLTDEGYADQLYDMIKPVARRLEHLRLGCPGETTRTMVSGGLCEYPAGSQLNQALALLEKHGRKVKLITIDMGVNDLLFSICIGEVETDTGPLTVVDPVCLEEEIIATAGRLATILANLKAAAHPRTKIIGMNYYNTFLVSWFDPRLGPDFAMLSAALAAGFNLALENTYGAFGIPTADVAQAFLSDRFDITVPFPPFGEVPINVVLICRLTYMCPAPPARPNIHANRDGYRVIAFAFLLELFGWHGS